MKAECDSFQDLSCFKVPSGFRGKNVVWVQFWWLISATLFSWSPQFAYGFRNRVLSFFGAKIGKCVKIRSSARITYPWFLQVGDYSWVGDDSVIYNLAPVVIGSNVAIAHRVYLCAGSHRIDVPSFDIQAAPVTIEDECWLPNDVFVGPGVTIGRGAVIGARSSVFKDMPAGMVCMGSPCRPVKPRVSEVIQAT